MSANKNLYLGVVLPSGEKSRLARSEQKSCAMLLLAFSLILSTSLISAAERWVHIGPWGGTVHTLALNPELPTQLYAGTQWSCLYNSANGGGQWQVTGRGMTNCQTVYTVAVAPLASSTLYAGTRWNGIFRSSDAGENWTATTSGLSDYCVRVLAINPVNAAELYAGSCESGVFRSRDGGNNWVAVNSGITDLSVMALTIDPFNPSAIYAGTSNNHLKVTRQGASITLPANGTVLGTWSDSAIMSLTWVGVMSSPYNGGAFSDARFDNFAVRTLASLGSTAPGCSDGGLAPAGRGMAIALETDHW